MYTCIVLTEIPIWINSKIPADSHPAEMVLNVITEVHNYFLLFTVQ